VREEGGRDSRRLWLNFRGGGVLKKFARTVEKKKKIPLLNPQQVLYGSHKKRKITLEKMLK